LVEEGVANVSGFSPAFHQFTRATKFGGDALVGNPIEASGWHTDVGSEPKDWEMCSREVAAGFYWLRELLRLIGSIM
jgi:hypothetical protein